MDRSKFLAVIAMGLPAAVMLGLPEIARAAEPSKFPWQPPGIYIIDYDENIILDENIGDRLPEIAKWIRSMTQNDRFANCINILGNKEPPMHYSFSEIAYGFSLQHDKDGQPYHITDEQAHKVAKRCAYELCEIGMIVDLYDRDGRWIEVSSKRSTPFLQELVDKHPNDSILKQVFNVR